MNTLERKDSLGDRIKRYERAYAHRLTPRSCLFVRVDGRAFHTFTRGCERPFDPQVVSSMVYATHRTAEDMQGFRLAYTQSDETSFLLSDFNSYETQGWFDYELSKVISISASLFTAHFNYHYPRTSFLTPDGPRGKLATFDARAFIVPIDDVPNVFLWRQRDWERNSLQMFARSFFSHKELHEKGREDIHEMLHGRGENWAHLSPYLKNGTFVLRDGSEVYDKLGYDDVRDLIGPLVT